MTRKKNKTTHKHAATPRHRIGLHSAQLEQIDDMISAKQFDRAHAILLEMEPAVANSEWFLSMLAQTSLVVEDHSAFARSAVKLHRLKPKNAGYVAGLAQALVLSNRPALAMRYLTEYLSREPEGEAIPDFQAMLADLREVVDDIVKEGDLDEHLVALHEETQMLAEMGEYTDARRKAQELLKHKPHFPPVWNNLALTYSVDGRYADAIETTLKLLAFDPDNIHALANLTMWHVLIGDRETALSYAKRLKESPQTAWEKHLKVSQALLYVQDYDGVLGRFVEEPEENETETAHAMRYHFAAVAAYALGDLERAKKLWQFAAARPELKTVHANLADLEKPIDDRHGAWAFEINDWIDIAIINAFQAVARQSQGYSEAVFERNAKAVIRKYPRLTAVAPAIFEMGDPMAVEFAVLLGSTCRDETLASAMMQFALGTRGSRKLRMKALMTARSILSTPPGFVKFWMEGEWREVELFDYEISAEPQPTRIPNSVRRFYDDAIRRSHADDHQSAAEILRKAIVIEPACLPLRNNLAAALIAIGKRSEAIEIIESIHEDDPNFLIGAFNYAKFLAEDDRADEAKAVLAPLLGQRNLHTSEFAALCGAQITIAMANENIDAGIQWLGMLREVDPTYPAVAYYLRELEKLKKAIANRPSAA